MICVSARVALLGHGTHQEGYAVSLSPEGLTLIAYTAEPGSHAQDQLDFLASWSTGQHERGRANTGDTANPLITPTG